MNAIKGDPILESPRDFGERVSLPFNDILLLRRALTHRSYLNEHPEALEDNERLEFLGDAVLDYVVGLWLYNRFPEMAEGDLTRLRAALVKTEKLAAFGSEIDIGKAIRLGRGEEENGGRFRNAMLCGAFEAIIGALSLDRGIDAVELFMGQFLERAAKEILLEQTDKDPKSRLQEIIQGEGNSAPLYRVFAEEGPDHAKTFEVEVVVNGEIIGRGSGKSKHDASMDAAKNALKKMELS